MICEWYVHLGEVVCRRSVKTDSPDMSVVHKEISSVGPTGSHVAQLLVVCANLFPIEYIEIIVTQENYGHYLQDLKRYYNEYPYERPYCPVVFDWIAADRATWVGKNAAGTPAGENEWFCAIMFTRQCVDRNTADQVFSVPIELSRKYKARMHWGKSP